MAFREGFSRVTRRVQERIETLPGLSTLVEEIGRRAVDTGTSVLSQILLRVEASRRGAVLEGFKRQYGMSGSDLALAEYPTGLDMADVSMVDQSSPVELTTRRPEAYNTKVTVRAGNEDHTFGMPIMNAAMASIGGAEFTIAMQRAGGMPLLHRMWLKPEDFSKTEEQKNELSLQRQIAAYRQCKENGVEPFVAVPVNVEWVDAVVAEGAKMLVIDTLKMSTAQVMDVIRHTKERHPDVWICAGNTVSPKEAWQFALAGADAIKVGIGPGAVCTTYETTGHGSSQWTATALVAGMLKDGKNAKILRQKVGRVPMVIADGGIKNTGDVGKLIGAGADVVMIGTRLAGTDECGLQPHVKEVVDRETGATKEEKWFDHWGQASTQATGRGMDGKVAVEGVPTKVPARGPLADVLRGWLNGMCASFAVTGATSIKDMQDKARFIRATTHAIETGKPLAKVAHDNGARH
ncbi:MAG: IMP dehydrogenase [Candidatus Kerfeldbacteria bacterium]|nr:IMP dehydrogenase [Candidatus Kerfeldbacteria bacterium]